MARLDLLATLVVVAMTSCRLTSGTECELLLKEQLESAIIEDRVPQKFKPVKFVDGSYYCAGDAPAASLPLGVIAGVGTGVSGPARCALYCQDLDGCVSFNYRTAPLTDGTQCQLFTKPPTSCSRTDQSCRHYEAAGNTASCKNTAGFTFDAPNRVYYKAFFEVVSWKVAAQRCADLGPYSHLAVFKQPEDYAVFYSFIQHLPASSLTPCKTSEWNGFWVAMRRQQYDNSRRFVWDLFNREDGALPQRSWESALWITNEPSGDGWAIHAASGKDWKLNDTTDTDNKCFICQIFAD